MEITKKMEISKGSFLKCRYYQMEKSHKNRYKLKIFKIVDKRKGANKCKDQKIRKYKKIPFDYENYIFLLFR